MFSSLPSITAKFGLVEVGEVKDGYIILASVSHGILQIGDLLLCSKIHHLFCDIHQPLTVHIYRGKQTLCV